MTSKQREDLNYISGWVLGLSYIADQATGEGLVDISECIDQLLREDLEQSSTDESKYVCRCGNSHG